MSKISWYINRLRAMSPGEVLHRAEEYRRKTVSRRIVHEWSDFDEGVGSLPSVPGLRKVILEGLDPSARHRYAAASKDALSGRFRLLGCAWPSAARQGTPMPWLLDPISGENWPGSDTYCFDVDYRNAPIGDVKFVWELNRLQFLPAMALTAASDADEQLAKQALEVIESWMTANPPFRGVNWPSGIELALRIISISTCLSFLDRSWVSENHCRQIRQLFSAHLYWIARFPSLHSSANNHLLAEAAGLFVGGALLPDLDLAPDYEASGRAILEREVLRQILPDGCGAEQATAYTAYVLELLLFVSLVAEAVGRPMSQAFHDRLGAAAEALGWFVNQAGLLPSIGDDDETQIVPDPVRTDRYAASVLSAAAGRLGMPWLATVEVEPSLRTTIFQAPAHLASAPNGMRTFPHGGYTAVREKRGGRCLELVFDHGQLGYLSIAAHGHADTLAIWLSLDGQPIFVDAGTYLYAAGGNWRRRLRLSEAHNTLTVDKLSSSVPSGAFNWSIKALGKVTAATDGRDWSIVAQHDGYAKRLGITHVRTLRADGAAILLEDRLLGTQRPHAVEASYLLHPTLTAVADGPTIVVSGPDGPLIRLTADGAIGLELLTLQDDDGGGWMAADFGNLVLAPRIVIRGKLATEVLETRIAVISRA